MAGRVWVALIKIAGCMTALGAVGSFTPIVRGGVQYMVTALGALPGSVYSYANAINDSGEIVGYSYVSGGPAYFGVNPYDVPGTWHAFVYINGQMTDLGAFGGTSSMASAINNSGQITGTIVTSSGTSGFLYSAGVETNLGSLGGTNTYATSINNAGQITGYGYTGAKDVYNDPIFHAFLYSGGGMTDLGTATGFPDVSGASINSSGEIVGDLYNPGTGNSAFLYGNGLLTNIGASIQLDDATGINDSGQIIGYRATGQGFLYSNGVEKSLGFNMLPRAINQYGEIVGYISDVNQNDSAIVDFGGVNTNLNTLISPTSGWDLQQAMDVNNSGDIVGFGLNPAGDQQAFLLTPVPEPGTIFLAVLGGAVVLCRGRSRRPL